MEVLAFLKEYWFLVTLMISLVTAISYMIVFHVSPWEKYREISERKQAVAFHLALGQKLLGTGSGLESCHCPGPRQCSDGTGVGIALRPPAVDPSLIPSKF
jgi:hypothetical protein